MSNVVMSFHWNVLKANWIHEHLPCLFRCSSTNEGASTTSNLSSQRYFRVMEGLTHISLYWLVIYSRFKYNFCMYITTR